MDKTLIIDMIMIPKEHRQRFELCLFLSKDLQTIDCCIDSEECKSQVVYHIDNDIELIKDNHGCVTFGPIRYYFKLVSRDITIPVGMLEITSYLTRINVAIGFLLNMGFNDENARSEAEYFKRTLNSISCS